jgi:hypothetical protein
LADPTAFTTLVPGFDFLQGLIKNAGNGLPGMGQWIAPSLDPEELEKRIRDLRTVQFWLEQNAKLLGATIQALEVQRMTLSTLKTMNVPLDAMRESLKMQPPAEAAAPAAPAADPMQWWTALTQQFGELAAGAMKDLPTPGAVPKASAAPAKKAAAKSRVR